MLSLEGVASDAVILSHYPHSALTLFSSPAPRLSDGGRFVEFFFEYGAQVWVLFLCVCVYVYMSVCVAFGHIYIMS